MKSVSLINPSGREVRVPDNRVAHLLANGFTIAPEKETKSPVFISPSKPAPEPAPEPEAEEEVDSLEFLTRDELVELAESRGLKFDGRLGAKKLRALITDSE